MEFRAGFFTGLLGFQPIGLSEIPLYNENSWGLVGLDSAIAIACVGVRKEDVRAGGFGGAAIDKAKDILIFILNANFYPIARAPVR